MLKYFSTLLLIVIVIETNCQDRNKIFKANWNAIDSLRMMYKNKVSDDSLANLEYYELDRQVRKFTIDLITKGVVTYPFGALHYDLTSTYYLQLKKRGIIFEDYVKEDNCVSWLHYSSYYDEMLSFFESKYGKGYFQRIHSEADSLDKIGLGLTLPKITNANSTETELKLMLSNTFSIINANENANYFCMAFRINKNNKIFDIEICRYGTPGLYCVEELAPKYSKSILAIVNSYKWESAKYLNKYIDRKVLFNLDNQKLTFYPTY